ncbi:MAG: FlgD immunoglobulin-like domain containing protein [Candidatus Krumholzibacteria bacterium]|jgi:hypothetical protein|nr:FlgD immunoglobulin-like domain containing protein [Candidatus Krumholzibacteria bacterium]MDP7021768.1 FlgD immunoglobulin-like domain containing protein [Candidatus Krumholzibacteria bacterium]
MAISCLAQPLRHGAGGAGWLHAGAFHPVDSDVLVIGLDVSGICRSDDSGTNWYPWNEGLANIHEAQSNYIEDLIGVDAEGWTGFYAATRGGLFRAREDGAWEWLTPPPDFTFDSELFYRPDVISFASLDVNLEFDRLVAGAGRFRWGKTEEFESYPGLADSLFLPWSGGPADQWSVWSLDPSDPAPLPSPLGDCRFGCARDVACRKLDGVDHVAVATPEGIFLYDGSVWMSIADMLYSDYGLDCWNLRMTRRGSLYAAMVRMPGAAAPSGLYRIADLRENLVWEWLGDGTPLEPDGFTMAQTGSQSSQAFAYLGVVEGEGGAEDILYLAARDGLDRRGGLYRAEFSPDEPGSDCTWMHKVWRESDEAFWQADAAGALSPLDPGWLTLWKGNILFPPEIAPSNPDRLLLSIQGRLHLSENGGHAWRQCYSEVNGDWAESLGYDELVTQAIGFLDDGRAVLGNADLGALISRDSSLDGWKWFYPLVDRDTTHETDAAYNREVAEIVVRPDWLGQGEDGLFILCTDITHHGAPSKIMRAWPGESENWINLTRDLETENKFIPTFCFAGDSVIFAPYLESSGPWGPGSTLAATGLLRGRYEGGNWSWETVNSGLGLGYGWNALGSCVLHHEASGRIFLSSELLKTPQGDGPGGIYMLDSPEADQWQLVFGVTGDWKNFQSLAQSADGTRLYAGTRGLQGMGYGGVLRCEDPVGAPEDWQVIANGDSPSFGFELPFFGIGWSEMDANRKLTDIQALAVDPLNADIVFASQNSSRFQISEGLWVFNLAGDQGWSRLNYGTPIAQLGAQALEFSPLDPVRLGIGTAGMQFWTLRTDSLGGSTGAGTSGGWNGLHLLAATWKGTRADIRYTLAAPAPVELGIYDVRGRLVIRRRVPRAGTGENSLAWFGRDERGERMTSGIYLLRLSAAGAAASGKLLLLR